MWVLPGPKQPYNIAVEPGQEGCERCLAGTMYTIIGPDDVMIGQSWGDPELAGDICSLMNMAYDAATEAQQGETPAAARDENPVEEVIEAVRAIALMTPGEHVEFKIISLMALVAEIERLTQRVTDLQQFHDWAEPQCRDYAAQKDKIERLRVVFDEACNEVKMSHGKPCFCKYCFEGSPDQTPAAAREEVSKLVDQREIDARVREILADDYSAEKVGRLLREVEDLRILAGRAAIGELSKILTEPEVSVENEREIGELRAEIVQLRKGINGATGCLSIRDVEGAGRHLRATCWGLPADPIKCAVLGCEYMVDPGTFAGDFCERCDSALRTGKFVYGTSVIFRHARDSRILRRTFPDAG